MRRLITLIAALILGAILIILSILLLTFIPLKIDREVAKETHLGFDENGTYNLMTRKWIDPDYKMLLQIWVLSIENEEDVVKNGSFPRFAQKGPYTFIEKQHKVKVDFLWNNTRATYRNKHFYWFDANNSCANCSLDDRVTIPNIIFQKLVDIALSGGYLVKEAIEIVLRAEKRETPFITVTVGEMLFDGYDDPLISAVCSKDIIRPLCDAAGISSKIGYMYGRNGTDDGEYLIGTGLEDRRTLGKVYKWNGMDKLPADWWSSEQARMINGTDGQLFPPSLPRSEDRYLFIGQIKRSIYMRYKMGVEFEGVNALRFYVPFEEYDYSRVENKGFCSPSTPIFFDNITQPEGCLPAGLLDISQTLPGHVRIYISGSHFFNSPSVLYKNFSGLAEPSSDDETFIDIEPTAGLVIYAKQMSQINVGMIAGNLRILSKMRNLIVPVLWLNETIRIDDATRQQLLNSFVLLKQKVFFAGVVLLTIGLLLWIAFILISVIHSYATRRSDETEQLIVQEDNENEDADN